MSEARGDVWGLCILFGYCRGGVYPRPARTSEVRMRSIAGQSPRRRRIRLAREVYGIVGQAFLVTVCARDRQAVLTSNSMPEIVDCALRSASTSVPMVVFAWCVMPDHVHMVVAPEEGGNVVDWVRRFKGRVATDARRQGLRSLWQRSFYDYVLRSDAEMADVVRYVLANPVRAGFVEDWRDWPHNGSLVWDLANWVAVSQA